MEDYQVPQSRPPLSTACGDHSNGSTHETTVLLEPNIAAPYLSTPNSPTSYRRNARPGMSRQSSNVGDAPDERSPLLPSARSRVRIQSARESSLPGSLTRNHSHSGSVKSSRHHSRVNSWGQRLMQALSERHENSMLESKGSVFPDERVWYDQFTSTDWVHDSIADGFRAKALRSRKDFWGRTYLLLDGAQGWILSALVGFLVAVIAYVVDVTEATVFDFKNGYCINGWWINEMKCCPYGKCTEWREWEEILDGWPFGIQGTEFAVYVGLVVVLASVACLLTLPTKTVVPSCYRMTTFDENLAAEARATTSFPDPDTTEADDSSVSPGHATASRAATAPSMVYYSAAGSGVAEVRVILSGFVLHGFLGVKTLVFKVAGLIVSVASGLSIGKEGPYVHIATCVGNIACRLFNKYDGNDAKRREVLSAAAAAGVAVAFGAPLGGVLFGLEEVAYFFPAKTLFRTFFCCITAALTLKFLDPYGTQKIVPFQVQYDVDWRFFELGSFIAVGILGGAAGAVFIKVSRNWATTFRRIQVIQSFPLFEVVLIALLTGLVSYWNALAKLPVAKLLFNLATPCDYLDHEANRLGLCPQEVGDFPATLQSLSMAFLIKAVLTAITFGIKVPAGIYVPSMVVGGLMGRIVGHLVQWVVMAFPHVRIWSSCALMRGTCIQPGVHGLIAAGATMCGVTRLSVTLVVVLFELTGSLDYVLPFSLAVLVAKWTADAMEPLSIYDLLTEMNSYPFLDNKHKPIFTSSLADIVPRVRQERVVDITTSPLVPAISLRNKLEHLHKAGELDGGLPIVRDGILVGLLPAPDLEFALDNLEDEPTALCLMAQVPGIDHSDNGHVDPSDFTPYIDPAPMALDIKSPMDLVYECFVKLGLRYICVLRNGRYAGMTHKKTFVKYIHELEERERHG